MTFSFNGSSASCKNNERGGFIARGEPDYDQHPTWFGAAGPEPVRHAGDAGVSGSTIAKLLEREIIPQLLLSNRPARRTKSSGARVSAQLRLDDLDGFAHLVLTRDTAEIIDELDALLQSGLPLTRLYLELLAPVARRIGEMWSDDSASFFEVSIGLSKLQQVLHEIARRKDASPSSYKLRHRIYLVPAPGEEHTFGLSMMEKFFLQAGWQTTMDHAAAETTIVDTVARSRFEVIALSVATARYFPPLRRLLKLVRHNSLNPDIVVLVGGLFVKENPEIAATLDGAITILNGEDAVDIAENLVVHPFQPLPLGQEI